jgi:hypothetical protein
MQRFFDQLIGDMRPIEVAGVDVIDSEPNDLAQDCDRAVVIFLVAQIHVDQRAAWRRSPCESGSDHRQA